MSTTKVANITANDNASNTVIVSPHSFWSGKAGASYLMKKIIPQNIFNKSKQPVNFHRLKFFAGVYVWGDSFIINIYHRFIGNYVKMMEVIDKKLSPIKT